MSPEKSLEAVVWVAVGGAGLSSGRSSVRGVNALKSWATRAYPDLWLIILGGLFVLIVLFMPKGIVGIPGQIQELRKRLKRRSQPSPCLPVEQQQAQNENRFHSHAEGVNKSFDGFKAIHDLNFYLDRGELRTIIGPNGAGKSTFLDLITGRTRPDSGVSNIAARLSPNCANTKSTDLVSAGV